jgi:hypothetical protein
MLHTNITFYFIATILCMYNVVAVAIYYNNPNTRSVIKYRNISCTEIILTELCSIPAVIIAYDNFAYVEY